MSAFGGKADIVSAARYPKQIVTHLTTTSRRNCQSVPDELDYPLVSGDELIGNVVEVVANDMRLRSDT